MVSLRRPLRLLARRIAKVREENPFQRDPELIGERAIHLERAMRYFRPEVRGGENIPEGPALLVGNHSGGLYTPEAYVLIDWWIRTRGAGDPLYFLVHDAAFALPWFGPHLRRWGGLPAGRANAEAALRLSAKVLVYPGGELESFRPWWERGMVDFGGRSGFVGLALRTGVPIVPIVTHGSHDTAFVLTRGARLARLLRLDRLRVDVLPLVLTIPWGVVPGFIPGLPYPAKIVSRCLPAIRFDEHGVEAADDPAVVDRCATMVLERMQAALTEMVEDRPVPLVQ
jgi:1-acyl-sn-glycerol-3-phosphate acyltransferase